MERSSYFLKKKKPVYAVLFKQFFDDFQFIQKETCSFSCVMAYQRSPLWTKMDENTPEISIETTGVLNYI